MKNIRTYSELSKLKSFKERYNYLKLDNIVGEETFGFDRYINQMFYKSEEWKRVRNYVISRDNGCDLGIPGREIYGKPVIDIINNKDFILNPEYLISTSKLTHDAIHYSDDSILDMDPIIRSPNDMCPWK